MLSLCVAGFALPFVSAEPGAVVAQAPAKVPDLSGAWAPAGGGGGRGGAGTPALKGEYATQYAQRRAAEQQLSGRGQVLGNASTACLPSGMPSMMAVAVYPIEILQSPKQITIIQEAFTQVRRIFIDKPQEKIEDVPPSYYGRSVGRWEGDTLVVDTVGIKDTVRYQNIPHSDQMRITERIRLTPQGQLSDEIKIEDPLALERPITYTLTYRRLPDYEMVEFVCDNNREYVDANGAVRMRLGSDK
jgi:hypothetical protein